MNRREVTLLKRDRNVRRETKNMCETLRNGTAPNREQRRIIKREGGKH